MAVEATGVVFKDIIQPPEMPRGLQTFWGQASITGVGTDSITINFPFNPDADVTFQPYVALCRATLRNTVAQQTGATWIQLPGASWERTTTTNNPVGLMPAPVSAGDGSFVSSINEFNYLGRVAVGTTGELRFEGKEVATAVTRLMITGIIGDRPFVAPEFWRV